MGNCCGKDAPTDHSRHKTSPNHHLQGPDPPKFMNGPPPPTTAVRDSMKGPSPSPVARDSTKGKGGGLQEQEEGEERGVQPRKEEDLCGPPLPANSPHHYPPHQSHPPLEQPKGRDDLGASLPSSFEQPRGRVLHKKEDDLNASLPAKVLHQFAPPLEQPRGVLHKKEEGLHASSLPAKKPHHSVPPLEQPKGRGLREKDDDLDASLLAKILHQSLPPPSEQPTRRGVLHKKEEGLHASSPLAKMPYHSLLPQTEQAQGRISEEILHVPLPAAMPRNFSPEQQEERQRISSRSKISHTPAPPPREHRDEGGSHKLLPTKMSDSLFPSQKEERAKMLHREQDYRI
ncbi:hypothetical protein OsI_30817 [Oryza sativa Indica Group]|uniref:Uncharacterized protein n=1 Tax=Oryza sativa subsp. indica TaxID=39946 RepID=B8BE80_ORYSI|nr:hypothetical protein OsI_30817 [Oryza sativa Indica Group]